MTDPRHSAPQARRLLVLDDDPTGSQCVVGVDVAFTEDPVVPAGVLAHEGATCFVLTNTRALDEPDAVAKNRRIVRGVLESGVRADGLHIVSRSDSTLRGHVLAEPHAIADELAQHGTDVDAFLFCPAMLEAGRFTQDDVHYARVDGEVRRVEDTDFARDATFGYSTSNLRRFLQERSDGAVSAAEVLSISLDDIRDGGVERVVEVLRGATERRWVVINATEYSDMDVVADAVGRLEADGRVFVSRCGPSFVRSLAGQSGAAVLGADDIRAAAEHPRAATKRRAHGLVVVGSHVGLTTQQLAVVQQRGGLLEVELAVPRLLTDDTREAEITRAAETASIGLDEQNVVIYTSRDLISTSSREESLAIARSVSDAVVEVVQRVRRALPAWVIAKGGITSHEVAAHGLGIDRARVQGQFWPGQISLFAPQEAPEDVLGCPYVVFPGNVGGRDALADVITRMDAAISGDIPHPTSA